MIVHIQQVPPEGRRYEGEEPAEILELDERHFRAVAPLHYALDVGLSDGGLWAHGRLWTTIECECVRCLSRFHLDLEVTDFACQVELQGRETVNLTEQLREDILLTLPAHPHCDWDGEKACKADFAAAESAVDLIDDHRDAWKALDQLKF